MILLGIVCALIVLIGFTRVGVITSYRADDLRFAVRVGFLRIALFPRKPSKKTKPGKKKKTRRERKVKEKKDEEDVKLVKLLIHDMSTFAKLGTKALRIDYMEFELVAGGDDPYSVSLLYGAMNIGVGFFLAAVHQALRVKKEKIMVSVDFSAPAPLFYGKLSISISVGRALWIWISFIKWFLQKRKNRTVTRSGK